MNKSTYLRIASGIALVQYVAHTYLFFNSSPKHGQDEVEVVESMKLHHWDFGGFNRGYWDFYFGYGLIAILFGVVEIGSLWQLSIFAKKSVADTRSMTLMWLLAILIHAIFILQYFFLLPVIFDGLVIIVLALAFFSTKDS